MLNTIMALWNQHPGENRQRIVKILFTFLFIGVSVSLLLFTLNNVTWTPVMRTEGLQTKKEEPVRMSKQSGMAPVGNTPASKSVVARITPTARRSKTRTVVQQRVPTPGVVVQQRATAPPQKAAIYFGNNGLENKSSNSMPMHPKVVQVRKSKLHFSKRSEVKVITIPKRHSRETINITLPALPTPVPTTVQLPVTPVVTEPAATGVPIEGTVVSGAPDSVVMNATPGILKSHAKNP